jgi:hypothetical protein
MTVDRDDEQAKDWIFSGPEPSRSYATRTGRKGFDALYRPNLHSPDQVRAQ